MDVFSKQMTRSCLKAKNIFVFVGFFAISLLVFFATLHGAFIWDDFTYIVNNPFLKTSTALYDIWFTTHLPDYWPLTYTMFWAEWSIWGTQTFGYHVVNLLLHTANSFLIWKIVNRYSPSIGFWTAVLFLVHPVNVETVAWIFQQKTSLAMCLFLISIDFFLQCESEKTNRRYGISVLFFFLSLLAKPIALAWPVILFCYRYPKSSRKGSLKQLIPFFVASTAVGVVNLVWQNQVHRLPVERFSGIHTIPERLAVSAWSLFFYLKKAFYPLHLMFIYPRFPNPHSPTFYLPIGALFFIARYFGKLWMGDRRNIAA